MTNRKMSKKISKKKPRKTKLSLVYKRKHSVRNKKSTRKSTRKLSRKPKMAVNLFKNIKQYSKRIYNYFKKNDSYERYLKGIFEYDKIKEVDNKINSFIKNKSINSKELENLNKDLDEIYEYMTSNIFANQHLTEDEKTKIKNRSNYLQGELYSLYNISGVRFINNENATNLYSHFLNFQKLYRYIDQKMRQTY